MRLRLLIFFFSSTLFANPYPDQTKVILPSVSNKANQTFEAIQVPRSQGLKVLRAEVTWSSNETYKLTGLFIENSGTEIFLKSSLKKDTLGSYKAELSMDSAQGPTTFHSSIGTGKEFRKLVRTLSFRFPLLDNSENFKLKLHAENPETGELEKVLDVNLDQTKFVPIQEQDVKVTLLKKASKTPALKFNFYAEGFTSADGEKKFIASAQKAMQSLMENIPESDSFEFKAVFALSKKKLGMAQDLGNEVKERDSFLGLYFPYWAKFGRWYNIVYPTNETKYRNGIAQEAYDYPLALVDDRNYWGVGNYKELTAVPINNGYFTYLLLHEFGHFMGLNEEYETGGPTELEFAPKIKEPWSQNITFNPKELKWLELTEPGIQIPTSHDEYIRFGGASKNPVGAYKGGYAESLPLNKSHKPVMQCMMGSGQSFCPVCKNALSDLIKWDQGL